MILYSNLFSIMDEDFFMHLHLSNRIWEGKDSTEHSNQREKYDKVTEMQRTSGQGGKDRSLGSWEHREQQGRGGRSIGKAS